MAVSIVKFSIGFKQISAYKSTKQTALLSLLIRFLNPLIFCDREKMMKDKSACLKIQKIRKSMGLTQSQFAELVDLSDDSIGKIERCVNVPTIETLYKISKALKMPVETFLPSSKEKYNGDFTPELKDLISYLRTRPSEDVRLIHQIAIKIFERKR